ncbi:MarR family transcriptional regulator [Saccharibacillus sp. O16]|nr:MarR family transcriptional regulator [Saccharibacillus sp. O16]
MNERYPISRWISLLYRQNQKQLKERLKPYGLGGGGQHVFLKNILLHPGIRQDQLTANLIFDKATTARAVQHLEQEGYIERRIDEQDRRSYLLYPTPKGVDFLPVLQRLLNEHNAVVTRNLSAEEEQTLANLLQKMYEG